MISVTNLSFAYKKGTEVELNSGLCVPQCQRRAALRCILSLARSLGAHSAHGALGPQTDAIWFACREGVHHRIKVRAATASSTLVTLKSGFAHRPSWKDPRLGGRSRNRCDSAPQMAAKLPIAPSESTRLLHLPFAHSAAHRL